MKTTKHKQNKSASFDVDGHAPHTIKSGSVWIVSESETETQVCLDRPGHPLDGLTICMDWTQGVSRPTRKVERITAIIEDLDILKAHAASHLDAT
jgi:hypothetical protein